MRIAQRAITAQQFQLGDKVPGMRVRVSSHGPDKKRARRRPRVTRVAKLPTARQITWLAPLGLANIPLESDQD